MTKKGPDELLKIEYGEKKGEGRICAAKPIKTPIGELNCEIGYGAKWDDVVGGYISIGMSLKEEFWGAYGEAFYDDEKLLTTHATFYPTEQDPEWSVETILKAKKPTFRARSDMRKYKDVVVEGPQMEEFLEAVKALADLMNNRESLLKYICQHDKSFEAQRAKVIKDEQERQRNEKRQEKIIQAAKQRERKARQEAEEKAQQRARVMIVIGVVLIIAGIYGLYKGYVICLAEESNFVTGLLVMGISFFLTIPIGLGIISNNKN